MEILRQTRITIKESDILSGVDWISYWGPGSSKGMCKSNDSSSLGIKEEMMLPMFVQMLQTSRPRLRIL